MDIPFTLLVAAPALSLASDFLSGTVYAALKQGKEDLVLCNKYFAGTIASQAVVFPPWPVLAPATGLVLLLSAACESQARDLLTLHQAELESLEVKMVFSAENTEELARLALDFEMEYESQDYEKDTTLLVEDGEKTGLSRVLEAVEVACASVVPRPDPVQEAEDLDDVDAFEELLTKVKAASENYTSLSDEERRLQAERVILEVVQRLGLDPTT